MFQDSENLAHKTISRKYPRWILAICVGFLVIVGVMLPLGTRFTPHVRDRAVAAINSRFQSEVALTSLEVSLLPRPRVRGEGLTIRHHGRTDVVPLIQVGTYTATAGVGGLLRTPIHLDVVELDRMDISIPPGGLRNSAHAEGASPAEDTGSRVVRAGAAGPEDLKIDKIISRQTRLEIVPRDPGKLPRVFEIHNLVMRGLGDGDGAPFEASLTNPTPRGLITTHGTFGPWRADDPRATPIRGEYGFKDANLDTIKGISGVLSSRGAYSGVLERIDVKGQTDAPDFSIDLAGQPVHLKTTFHAVVDGTNGNTFLEQVEARLLETAIVAKGAVERTEDIKGRQVTLDVEIRDGRIEDVLKLGVKGEKPPMTGRMQLAAKFRLPAGDRDVMERLELDGTFKLAQAHFTNVDVQERIDTLSRRGRGDVTNEGRSVVSNFSGAFVLRLGSLSFSSLQFAVPGALVQLAGVFDLKAETLDFAGHLLLDAPLAETTTGVKSLMARAAQPFFRRPGGGSRLPIRISGPRAKPEFGLDVKKAVTPGD